ncbi:DNA repair ATPase [Psychromonas arctica]|uniref:DNA repair ATPase n=1 Tax=Psychromonas arctica TaxID=168275 RepID=A0ABU9HBX3_9GAMM
MYPLIISLVALLLIVMIGYNIIQQYKQKVETERRISVAKQHAVISEVDELLLYATKIPFTKILLLILKNRIRNALFIMMNMSPSTASYKEHFADTEAQIKQINENYIEQTSNSFQIPNDDKEAVNLIKVTKKIRAVLRSEHAKGKINTNIFVAENRNLEIMQLKINLDTSIKRIIQAKSMKEYGAAKQMIDKLLKILESIPDKDNELLQKQQLLVNHNSEVLSNLSDVSTSLNEESRRSTKENSKQKDIEMLFGDKQKW